ncbi:piRNA biogenesis protein EXD1-like [Acipenser ruthenus]|uniref:piRNA biogenesis protein EXD1-like n=1 Tax=Acipenser ruthenus TaxID=7906 RepID=UPI00274039FB|nr:piRNA biogenesis protein EXD1-like [Acipenser ruthenus]
MDSTHDYHFLDYFKKKRVKLTLTNCSSYFGTVQRINLNRTVILEEVVDAESGRNLQGVKLFFGHEIQNVEFPFTKDHSGRRCSTSGDYRVSPAERDSDVPCRIKEGQLTVAEFQPYRKSMDDEEENVDFVVIDQFQEKFGPAIIHIQNQRVIGVGVDGVGFSQHERVCWMQISTKNQIYLFDILLLGARAFKNGLTRILEDSNILKVIHDCRGISGCLYHQYAVNLANIFDTQVADVMLFHMETGGFLPERVSTLEECIIRHLKIASFRLSSLKLKAQLAEENSEVWYMRPSPVSLLRAMALSVIHLQPLRLVLLDALMSDYISLVDTYLSVFREEPVDIQTGSQNTSLELPKELQELEFMQKQRREWALEHYKVNEDGLLVRSDPKPLKKSPGGSAQPLSVDRPQSHEPPVVEADADAESIASLAEKDPTEIHKPMTQKKNEPSDQDQGVSCVSKKSEQPEVEISEAADEFKGATEASGWDYVNLEQSSTHTLKSGISEGSPKSKKFQSPVKDPLTDAHFISRR